MLLSDCTNCPHPHPPLAVGCRAASQDQTCLRSDHVGSAGKVLVFPCADWSYTSRSASELTADPTSAVCNFSSAALMRKAPCLFRPVCADISASKIHLEIVFLNKLWLSCVTFKNVLFQSDTNVLLQCNSTFLHHAFLLYTGFFSLKREKQNKLQLICCTGFAHFALWCVCVCVFLQHSLALPLYRKVKVTSPPRVFTEQHVPDIKKSCRFPLPASADVLEEGRVRGGPKKMLIWVVFPAISDVAFSMKCEAFKDLRPSMPRPPPFLLLMQEICAGNRRRSSDGEIKSTSCKKQHFEASPRPRLTHWINMHSPAPSLLSLSSFIHNHCGEKFLTFSLSL